MSLEKLQLDRALLEAAQAEAMELGIEWWHDTTDKFKKRIWDVIQKDYSDIAGDVVSRLADIGMRQLAIEAIKRQQQAGKDPTK